MRHGARARLDGASKRGAPQWVQRHVPVPFKGLYAPSVALVILTLFPQLINTAAYPTLARAMAPDFHVPSAAVMQYPLYYEAAFVFGILAGTSLIRRYDVRKVFLPLLAADVALTIAMSFAGINLEAIVLNAALGLIGGMFLMVALPPLFMKFEAKYFPASAALMVPCLFGAATLAPVVAAPLAAGHLWRPLFWGEAVVLVLAFVLALLTVASSDPQQPDAPVDWFALVMGALGMACIFAGIFTIGSHEWSYLPSLVPFVTGVAVIALLVIVEYFKLNGLLPMKQMLTSFAVIGFVSAAAGNAIYIAIVAVTGLNSQRVLDLQPMQIAALSWPLFAFTVVTGLLFAWMIRTKWMPFFVLTGLIAICVGSGLFFADLQHQSPALSWASTCLMGYGAGATITPGLFMAGLSVKRNLVARGIASIEVVRLTMGFISGPLAQHSIVSHARDERSVTGFMNGDALATGTKAAVVADTLRGMHWTMAYIIGFAGLATIVFVLLLFKYYKQPHAPDLERYVKQGKPAFDSPAL